MKEGGDKGRQNKHKEVGASYADDKTKGQQDDPQRKIITDRIQGLKIKAEGHKKKERNSEICAFPVKGDKKEGQRERGHQGKDSEKILRAKKQVGELDERIKAPLRGNIGIKGNSVDKFDIFIVVIPDPYPEGGQQKKQQKNPDKADAVTKAVPRLRQGVGKAASRALIICAMRRTGKSASRAMIICAMQRTKKAASHAMIVCAMRRTEKAASRALSSSAHEKAKSADDKRQQGIDQHTERTPSFSHANAC